MPNEPLVTMILLSYRQEKFIRQAVRSALAQDYGNLEIVFSDDASSDRTFEIITEETSSYSGPHKLILNRNPKNLGLAGNMNKAVMLASSSLLVFHDGDDISVPSRTSKLVHKWLSEQPQKEVIFSNAIRISEDDSVLDQQSPPLRIITAEEAAAGKLFIAGQAVSAYAKSLFERHGWLDPAVVYVDYVLTFRALLGGGCAFLDEPLVYYRLHDQSITQTSLESKRIRTAAAKWAKHAVAEEEDRLRAWDLSGRKNRYVRWRLCRTLGYVRLDARSSTASRMTALGCVLRAVVSGRPNAAWLFLRRDILNWRWS